jgi:tRNA (guanine-N7-)-methyltransferase
VSRGRRISRVKFLPPDEKTAEKYLREWDHRALHHEPDQFPALTSQNLFGVSRALCIDIGAGTGEFLLGAAKQQPDLYFLGIEISRRAVYFAVHQAAQVKMKNLIYIRADFNLLYPLLAPNSLEMVYLNFPDPNYGGAKRRKHRIFSPRFLDAMYTALTSEGKIQVVTDQHPFLLDMTEIAENDPRFIKTHSGKYLTYFSPPAKTRFQLAWEKYQRPVFRFELEKV